MQPDTEGFFQKKAIDIFRAIPKEYHKRIQYRRGVRVVEGP